MSRHLVTICAAALAVAACNTTEDTVAGGSGQATVVGGVNSGGYTDVNGVYHRYDRYGYYAANGAYIPYANARGAWCARWNSATNTCVWWLTG